MYSRLHTGYARGVLTRYPRRRPQEEDGDFERTKRRELEEAMAKLVSAFKELRKQGHHKDTVALAASAFHRWRHAIVAGGRATHALAVEEQRREIGELHARLEHEARWRHERVIRDEELQVSHSAQYPTRHDADGLQAEQTRLAAKESEMMRQRYICARAAAGACTHAHPGTHIRTHTCTYAHLSHVTRKHT